MFRALPPHVEARKGHGHGCPTDLARRNALSVGHGSGERQRPDTRRMAARAWTLVEQGPQTLAAGRIKDGMGPPMGRRRPALQGQEAPGVERPDNIADGLVVTAQRGGDETGRLAACTGQEDLAAPHTKGIGRP
jgi:hypothetical protein